MAIKHSTVSLKKKIADFDPNSPGLSTANLFGLPFSPEESACVVIPVPWEVTVSYGGGTLEGPEAIFEASKQIDLHDPLLPHAWKMGIAMNAVPTALKRKSRALRKQAAAYIAELEAGTSPDRSAQMKKTRDAINRGCEAMVDHVEKTAADFLEQGKMVALIGGDHSTPLGFLRALAGKHSGFGILQIDAHADLRSAYEGFSCSHASIMHNALKLKQVTRLVQAGIRDICDEEIAFIKKSKRRVVTYFDRDMKRAQYGGESLRSIHQKIVRNLPDNVYVSFDVDGLDPKLCPNTGTPVPGGLEFEESLHLVQMVMESGRTIIGFDINEVSPGADEWDANVGARLLFRMINIMAKSQGVIF